MTRYLSNIKNKDVGMPSVCSTKNRNGGLPYLVPDSCPFRDERFTDVEYGAVPVPRPRRKLFTRRDSEEKRRRPGLLTSLIYEDHVKSVTKRVTMPTIAFTRKAYLNNLHFETQDDNRVKYIKMNGCKGCCGAPIPVNMYRPNGSLRYQGRAAQRMGEPVGPEKNFGRSTGGLISKQMGVNVYHTATPKCDTYRTLHSSWAAKQNVAPRDFRSRRPAALSHYSMHNPGRLL